MPAHRTPLARLSSSRVISGWAARRAVQRLCWSGRWFPYGVVAEGLHQPGVIRLALPALARRCLRHANNSFRSACSMARRVRQPITQGSNPVPHVCAQADIAGQDDGEEDLGVRTGAAEQTQLIRGRRGASPVRLLDQQRSGRNKVPSRWASQRSAQSLEAAPAVVRFEVHHRTDPHFMR